jgi:hypothetical protein
MSMSIGAVGGFDPSSFAVSSAMARKSSAGNAPASNPLAPKTPEDNFLDYMKMSPGERMIENWLEAHHLSKEKLAAMAPDERNKIMKEMQDDIAKQLKEQTKDKAQVDILA